MNLEEVELLKSRFFAGVLLTLGGPQNPLNINGIKASSPFVDGVWDGLTWYFVGFINIFEPAKYNLYWHGMWYNDAYKIGFIVGLIVISAVLLSLVRSLSAGWVMPGGPLLLIVVVILLLLALRS